MTDDEGVDEWAEDKADAGFAVFEVEAAGAMEGGFDVDVKAGAVETFVVTVGTSAGLDALLN